MNEHEQLQARVTVTVLRRISALAAIAVTLAVLPATAGADGMRGDSGADPRVQYFERLEALAEALDGVGTSCERAAVVLEDDSDVALETLIEQVRDITSDPDVEIVFREQTVPRIEAVLTTKAWKACAKVTNVRFASAASRHPLLKASRVGRAYLAAQAKRVKQFESILAGQAALTKKLDATKGCPARAAIVRASSNAKTKKQRAVYDQVLFSKDIAEMQYAANRIGQVIPPELTVRVMRACSTHDGFMTAALKHPFMSVGASAFDARAKSRPRTVAARTVKKVDGLIARIGKEHAAVKRTNDCDEIAERVDRVRELREDIVDVIAKHKDVHGRTWMIAHVNRTLVPLDAAMQQRAVACAQG
jgi:hypothetical protein